MTGPPLDKSCPIDFILFFISNRKKNIVTSFYFFQKCKTQTKPDTTLLESCLDLRHTAMDKSSKVKKIFILASED